MSAPPPAPTPPPSRRRPATVVIAIVLVAALVVSGVGLAGLAAWSYFSSDDTGGTEKLADPPEPSTAPEQGTNPADLKTYYEQELDWRDCGGNQCARLKVPLDYAKPDGKSISLAVVRVPATRRSERVGQLVVNPGGPGGSGVSYALGGAGTFGSRLSRYFDIVGFDPRGVGQSTPLKCGDTAQMDEFLAADSDPETPDEVARLDELTREFGEACLENSGDLARHLSTVEVAKDLDVLRAALGEPRLDFLGASYGTFIGATYAELFPRRVRRMVLDGAVDPAQTNEELSRVQAGGFETALRAYLQDCAGGEACFLGDNVDVARQRIRQLLDQIDAKPLPTNGDRPLTTALAAYGVIYPLYNQQTWPLLTAALKQAFSGKGDLLLLLADQYASRGLDRYTNNAIPVMYAVNCLDRDEIIPSSEVPSYFGAFDEASPTFGRIFAYGLSSCAEWPVHSGKKSSALRAQGAPPIVVVGTTRDPATPYRQAVALAGQLESGVLVSRDGDGHTGFKMGNKCVDRAVEAYLIGGKVPQDGLPC